MERIAIVHALEELASLSELLGENPFKSRAYASAARAVAHAAPPEETWSEPDVLEGIPGVGKGTAERVREMIRTGAMADLEEMRRKVPEGVRNLLGVQGLGPKKVSILWKDLDVSSLGELEYACLENRLVTLPGFGPKTQEKVLSGVRFKARHAGKMLLPVALAAQASLEENLKGIPGDVSTGWAGEAYRLCPVVSGLELLAAGREAARAIAEKLGIGESGGGAFGGKTDKGCHLTVRSVEAHSFGAAQVWYGSSDAFRDALARELARGGVLWNAGGLSRDGQVLPAPDESTFWRRAGRTLISPECRESAGALDVDPALLVRESDLAGAFHNHTDWSDGGATLEEMVASAEALGWAYVGIADHSSSAVYANGLDARRLMAQKDAIAEVQARHPAIRIFTGVESDILADGSLDYDADVLAGVDAVVASVHSRFTLDEDSQTRRLVRAVSHPATAFLGHPTGRLLLSREGYPHRWEDVVTAAAKCATAIELNANPHRLDVDWTRIPGLRDAGIRIGINPDAHSPEGLKDVRYGIIAARKGLARKRDVVNTMDTDDMAAYLSDRKDGRS